MDQEIRNKLRNVVTQCRKLLEDDTRDALEGKYGIFARKDQVTADPNAGMTHLSDEEQAARKDILDHFGHIKARGFKPKDALDQLIREIAFTHLNRLCAYKMMEARQVYVSGQKFREAVSRGVDSNGVKFYLAEHEEDERLFNTGHQDIAYRHFLDWLGGLLSDEIGVLFNPNDPANRLYPRQLTLDEVLDLLNGGGIKAEETELREQWPLIWSQDETIGWVYQYFTPKELRDQARKESQAPRNSYELAFRNQFFTPRYVVEFLTDNTLGRIWYEMRKGDTKLAQVGDPAQCRYMVRRPTEIFLNDGEQPPNDAAEGKDDLSQEELLKLPVHIPHRPKKDPRELKILDPACGSGHFLLYCFDLLLTIYEEAHADPDLGPALKKDYPTLDDLKRDVPRLILAHNLHGIDIDVRASQIAALALWLRCQRAYQEMGLKKDRPQITRSNFVCAEPMPGEEQMLKEFVSQLEPKVLGQVVEVVFDKMKLAGEAGSLLKIEEEIRDAVAAAKKQYVRETTHATDRRGQALLFTQAAMDRLAGKPEQPSLFDLSDITDNQFFEQAEARVIEALRSYAEKAQNGQRLQRQLFTEDAVRGFAFVDLGQKQYDVVLMNPPFGEPSILSKQLLQEQYADAKHDLYAAFVDRGVRCLHSDGLLGAITSRTGFFLSSFQKWRESLLLGEASPSVFADLGHGVLDTAMVETAAYCVAKTLQIQQATFFRLLQATDKGADLLSLTVKRNSSKTSDDTFVSSARSFRLVPGSPFAYWLSDKHRRLFTKSQPFESEGRETHHGLSTTDDFRFVRVWWEVSFEQRLDCQLSGDTVSEFQALCRHRTNEGRRWVPFVKGGVYSPFYAPLYTVIEWGNDGAALKSFLDVKIGAPGQWSRWINSVSHYFRPGITWPLRGVRLSTQAVAAGTIFSVGGKVAVANSIPDLLTILAITNSRIFDFLVGTFAGKVGGVQYEVGLIAKIPIPNVSSPGVLQRNARKGFESQRFHAESNEITHDFLLPELLRTSGQTLRIRVETWITKAVEAQKAVDEALREIDEETARLYDVSPHMPWSVHSSNAVTDQQDCLDDESETQPARDAGSLVRGLVSYGFGCVLGRWDISVALNGNDLSKPDVQPFSPLPVYSPGMLKQHGRQSDEAVSEYPLRMDTNGVLADDVGHRDDIVLRVREVLEIIWRDRAESIEKEACEILGVKELRDYFRKSGKGGFWDDHISRYSKSRRKAPIYWLLQSSKKNYAMWLYYHRLDKDLLFKTLVNYVEPKIRLETSRLDSLRSQKAAAGESGKEAKRLAKDVERQEDFLSELRDFEDKLRRAANLHLEPDLNDGVVLNIAPLWELVPWKEAKKYWDELLAGKYEWSSIGKQLREKGLVKC